MAKLKRVLTKWRCYNGKGKQQVTHSAFEMRYKKSWIHFAGEAQEGKTTTCGKTAHQIYKTNNYNNVTCPRCLELMKLNNWYCEEHGFIADATVTNNETCEICGREVG